VSGQNELGLFCSCHKAKYGKTVKSFDHIRIVYITSCAACSVADTTITPANGDLYSHPARWPWPLTF